MSQDDKLNSWVVYKHTNKTNGKVYIGITHNYKRRWSVNNYKSCYHFYYALLKYGWDGFEHEFIETNLTQEEASEKEIYYIKLYDSTNPQKGYNISQGGSAPMWGRKHTEQAKQQMSEHNGKYWKNKHLTQEMIDKISKTKMGSIPWNKDISHTEETKNKISKKAKTRLAIKENNPMFGKLGKDNPNSEIIYCIELQQEFIGIREAARKLGLNFPNIIRSLKSNGKYSGGSLPNIGKTHWIYKEREKNENN